MTKSFDGPRSDRAADLRISLLGPVVVEFGNQTIDVSGKLGAVFALLADSSGRSLGREVIAAHLWGDKDDERALHNLRQLVSRLRKLPCADAIVITEQSLALTIERVDCDLWRFRRLAASDVAEDLAAAAALHRGEFCQSFTTGAEVFDGWLSDRRNMLSKDMSDVCMRVGHMEFAAGQPGHALRHARQALSIDDFREDAHRLVMQALASTDRRAEAIRHYDALAAYLEAEIDSEPDELTQALAVSLKQESGVTDHTATGGVLTARDGRFLERIAERAVTVDAAAQLVIRRNEYILEPEVSQFSAVCRALASDHGLAVLAGNNQEIAIEARSVRLGAAIALALLRQPVTGQAQMGLHLSNSAPGKRESHPPDFAVARQLSRLAQPGQLLLSVDAREQLVATLDADLEDLGDVGERQPASSLRAFAALPVSGGGSVQVAPDFGQQLFPAIAVIPFTTSCGESSHRLLGDLFADEIIAALCRTPEIRVISRLSTTACSRRQLEAADLRRVLGATYAASGTCHVMGNTVRLAVEFSDLRTSQTIWMETLTCQVSDALQPGGLVEDFAGRMLASVMRTELSQARLAPFEALANSTLLLGAIAMMHQLSQSRFELSKAMLDTLIERDGRHAAPHAWLAMHRLLRVSQGWSADVDREAALASDDSRRALDLEPDNSLALAVDAHVHTQFRRDFDGAGERLSGALASNPSNSLAWLFKSAMHAFKGEGKPAVEASENASRLSPLDPRRWFYDSLGATAALGAGDYGNAIRLAKCSIQINAAHSSTFRALAIAQSLSGRMDEARLTVSRLMNLQPGLTVSGFRARNPSIAGGIGGLWADALLAAGVPN